MAASFYASTHKIYTPVVTLAVNALLQRQQWTAQHQDTLKPQEGVAGKNPPGRTGGSARLPTAPLSSHPLPRHHPHLVEAVTVKARAVKAFVRKTLLVKTKGVKPIPVRPNVRAGRQSVFGQGRTAHERMHVHAPDVHARANGITHVMPAALLSPVVTLRVKALGRETLAVVGTKVVRSTEKPGGIMSGHNVNTVRQRCRPATGQEEEMCTHGLARCCFCLFLWFNPKPQTERAYRRQSHLPSPVKTVLVEAVAVKRFAVKALHVEACVRVCMHGSQNTHSDTCARSAAAGLLPDRGVDAADRTFPVVSVPRIAELVEAILQTSYDPMH